jgi:hypothetical protein
MSQTPRRWAHRSAPAPTMRRATRAAGGATGSRATSGSSSRRRRRRRGACAVSLHSVGERCCAFPTAMVLSMPHYTSVLAGMSLVGHGAFVCVGHAVRGLISASGGPVGDNLDHVCKCYICYSIFISIDVDGLVQPWGWISGLPHCNKMRHN